MDELTPADRKKRLQSHKEALAECDATLGRAAWRWGALLKDIVAHALWREDGQRSFTAWCAAELAISQRAANRAIILTEHFTEEMAGRFGSRKLAGAIAYMELTGKLEKPGDILALEIRYRGANGKFTSVPFAKASVRQLDAACKALREAARARDEQEKLAAIEQEVWAQIEALEKDLPAAPPGTVRGDRVVAHKGTDGTVALTVQGVPVDEWMAFLAFRRRGDGA